jgi:hypothetical protein
LFTLLVVKKIVVIFGAVNQVVAMTATKITHRHVARIRVDFPYNAEMTSIKQTHISLYSLQSIYLTAKLNIVIVAPEKPLELTKFQIFQRTSLDFNGTVMK